MGSRARCAREHYVTTCARAVRQQDCWSGSVEELELLHRGGAERSAISCAAEPELESLEVILPPLVGA